MKKSLFTTFAIKNIVSLVHIAEIGYKGKVFLEKKLRIEGLKQVMTCFFNKKM